MIKYTQNERNFINFVKSECKKYGIKCSLRNSSYVKFSPKIRCSGWFDSKTKLLVVSMNRVDWIEILAHEYSHLTQWRDKLPLWEMSEKSLENLDKWIDGKEIDTIDYDIDISRDLELDNEKRTVKIIKKFGLKVDLDKYIKKCNAYVHFYNWIKISKRWSKPTNSPYKNKKILSAMSPKFNMNYKKLSVSVERIFREENI